MGGQLGLPVAGQGTHTAAQKWDDCIHLTITIGQSIDIPALYC